MHLYRRNNIHASSHETGFDVVYGLLRELFKLKKVQNEALVLNQS